MKLDCETSCFHSADYDEDTNTLSVKFHGNNTTYYYRATPAVIEKMISNKSPGSYFIKNIKPKQIKKK